jgi:hypothetical protein
VRFPALRAANDESPYGFHLALASYFRSAGERHEDRRQLAKAFRARETGGGYEAARRWAGLLLEDGDAPRARSVIDAYLSERPDGVGNVLGPYVRLCVREGRYDEAERVIAREPPSRRRDFLWADVLRGMGRQAELTALLEETVRTALERIARDLAALMPGDRAGWECRGDRELLPRILELLDSGIDASMLEQVEAAHWPDVTAYPDFSDDLAWLSRALGELAEVGADLSPERRRRYAEAAALLDYPRRLERHLDRDGRWIWEHGALG